jgi:hypothetical protein
MFVKLTLIEGKEELKVMVNSNLVDYIVDNDKKEKDTCVIMMTNGMKSLVKGSYDDICALFMGNRQPRDPFRPRATDYKAKK